jgi:hypothetical protein
VHAYLHTNIVCRPHHNHLYQRLGRSTTPTTFLSARAHTLLHLSNLIHIHQNAIHPRPTPPRASHRARSARHPRTVRARRTHIREQRNSPRRRQRALQATRQQRLRHKLLRLYSPQRPRPLLPPRRNLHSRHITKRSLLSPRRRLHRDPRSRCPHSHRIPPFHRARHNHNHRILRASQLRPQRRPSLNGTKRLLPFSLYTHDLQQCSGLQQRLHFLSRGCCELYDCASEWRYGGYGECAEWRGDDYGGPECGVAECAEHLFEFESAGVFGAAGGGV